MLVTHYKLDVQLSLYLHTCHVYCSRCHECQEIFTNQSAWKDHLKQHSPKTDVDPFLCPHCNKQFSSKYGLANHMNLHLPEGERPYKCQYCNKGFGAKHAMTKHERTHLPDEERLSYICDVCGKRYISSVSWSEISKILATGFRFI
jgi:KRAB domain-containing zinc finger protein